MKFLKLTIIYLILQVTANSKENNDFLRKMEVLKFMAYFDPEILALRPELSKHQFNKRIEFSSEKPTLPFSAKKLLAIMGIPDSTFFPPGSNNEKNPTIIWEYDLDKNGERKVRYTICLSANNLEILVRPKAYFLNKISNP